MVAEGRDARSGQPYALIAGADMGSRLALQHLFAVILRRSVRVCADCAEAGALLQAGLRPRAALLGCSEQNDLIRRAASGGACVIALDHQGHPEDPVRAFLAGAEDVVRLPISLKEMALRLGARLGAEDCGLADCWLDLSADWDSEADIASRAGLTAAEAQVVNILINRSGQIVTRDELSHAIDSRPWSYGDRKFDVHVAKIRKKLTAAFGPQISVHTVRASGYRMTVSDPFPAAQPVAE